MMAEAGVEAPLRRDRDSVPFDGKRDNNDDGKEENPSWGHMKDRSGGV